MSVYLIVCLPERGAYYPTFALARALIARGQTVLYPGLSDFREDIERQGFTYAELFPHTAGADPNVGEVPAGLVAKLLYYRRKVIENPHRFRMLEAMARGEVADFLRKHQVDVVLLDAFLSPLAPAFCDAGVTVISMATELLNFRSHAIPPATTLCEPRDTAWSRAMCHTLWMRHMAMHYLKRGGLSVVTRALLFPRPPRELVRAMRRMRRGMQQRSMFSEYGWRFELPEIVLCPRAFDFPQPPHPNRRYLGMTIDRHRVDPPMEAAIPTDRPVVYVSLGTHAAIYGMRVNRFLDCVLSLARTRPQYFFVVNIGKGNDAARFSDPPENVRLRNYVPQLQVLERCAAIVTNGGLGTVKEAIMAEVPLLVVPCRWDQFGNAARVAYHGLGEYADVNRISPEELGTRLDRVLGNARHRENLRRMKHAIEAADEFRHGVEWLLSFAAPTPGAVESASRGVGQAEHVLPVSKDAGEVS